MDTWLVVRVLEAMLSTSPSPPTLYALPPVPSVPPCRPPLTSLATFVVGPSASSVTRMRCGVKQASADRRHDIGHRGIGEAGVDLYTAFPWKSWHVVHCSDAAVDSCEPEAAGCECRFPGGVGLTAAALESLVCEGHLCLSSGGPRARSCSAKLACAARRLAQQRG